MCTQVQSTPYVYIAYSGKISRTINFAVFEHFTTTSKINSSKSYYSIESYNLVDPQNFYLRNVSWRDNIENFLPQNLPTIWQLLICSSGYIYQYNTIYSYRQKISRTQMFEDIKDFENFLDEKFYPSNLLVIK